MDWGKALKGWDRKNPFEDRNKPKGQFLTSAEKQSNTLKELQKGWKENERIIESGQGIIESVESERLAPPNFD